MIVSYETDIIAWANQQAQLLRSGRWSEIDVTHIVEEIEDVGKSEQRELESRMVVLITHFLKWQYQPQRQGKSWLLTIKEQRNAVHRRLKKTPSLKASLNDEEWWNDVWLDARVVTEKETLIDFDKFPQQCPWTIEHILAFEWMPE